MLPPTHLRARLVRLEHGQLHTGHVIRPGSAAHGCRSRGVQHLIRGSSNHPPARRTIAWVRTHWATPVSSARRGLISYYLLDRGVGEVASIGLLQSCRVMIRRNKDTGSLPEPFPGKLNFIDKSGTIYKSERASASHSGEGQNWPTIGRRYIQSRSRGPPRQTSRGNSVEETAAAWSLLESGIVMWIASNPSMDVGSPQGLQLQKSHIATESGEDQSSAPPTRVHHQQALQTLEPGKATRSKRFR